MSSRTRLVVVVAGVALLLLFGGLAVRLDSRAGGLTGSESDHTAPYMEEDGAAEAQGGAEDSKVSDPPPVVTRADGSSLVGSPVESLSVIPQGAVVFVDSAVVGVSTEYRIVFSPYGYAPASDRGECMVIRIISAEPLGATTPSIDVSGRDFVCMVDLSARRTATTMDRYTGVLGFQPVGADLVPLLTDVQAFAQ